MRAIIWAAVSSKSQASDEKDSIPSQIEGAKEYLNNRDGWHEIHEPLIVPGHTRNYGGVSPLTDAAADVPAYEHLLQLAREDSFDLLICRSRDRLGRSAALVATIERYLAEHGIQVYSLEMPTAVTDPDKLRKGTDRAGIWTAAIERARSEDELAQLRLRHEFGMRGRVQRGLHAGKLPYGYQKGPEPKSAGIVYEPEAEVVRLIYRWFLEGMSLTRILERLPDYAAERSPGHTSTLRYILTNPYYCGLVSWSRTKRSGKPKPRSEWLLADGLHEPIIDRDTWERVQPELDDRTIRMGPRTCYPLTGVAYCGYCNRRMKGSLTQKVVKGIHYRYRFYMCGKPGCQRNSVRADHLEQVMAEWILLVGGEPEILREVIADAVASSIDTNATELESMERVLSQKRSGLIRWTQDYELGLLSRDEFYGHYSRLRDEIASLEQETEKARHIRREPESVEEIIAELANLGAEGIAQSWEDDDEARRVRVRLGNAGVRVTIKDRRPDIAVVLAQ